MSTVLDDELDSLTGWTTNGSPTVGAAGAINGASGLIIDTTGGAATQYIQKALAGGTRVHAFRFYIRVETRPATTVNAYVLLNANGQPKILVTSGGVIQAQVGAGTIRSGPTLTNGVVYMVEGIATTSGGTATLDWRVDQVAQTQATQVQTAADMTFLRMGCVSSNTLKADFDSIKTGNASGDYPAGGVDQTVGALALLDGSSAIYAPTIAPKYSIGALALLDASSAIYAPTLTPKNTIGALALLDGSNAIYEPTVEGVAGPQSVGDLALLDASSAIYAPSVVPGPVTVGALGLIDSGSAIYSPTVLPQAITAGALPLLDAGSAIYAPALTTTISLGLLSGLVGDLSLFARFTATTEVAQATVAARGQAQGYHVNVFVDTGNALGFGVDHVVGLLTREDSINEASLELDTVDLGLVSMIAEWSVALEVWGDPTALSIRWRVWASLDAVPAWRLSSDSYADIPRSDATFQDASDATFDEFTVTPIRVYEPTVVAGAVSVDLPLLDGGSAVYAPTVVPGSVTAALGLIESASVIYDLTVLPISAATLPLLDGAAAIYAPTVLAGAVTVDLDLQDAGPAIYAPTLTTGAVAVDLTLIDSGSAIYAPEVQPDQAVDVPLLDGTNDIYAVTVEPGSVTVSPDLIESASAIYDLSLQAIAGGALPLIDGAAAIYSLTVEPGAVLADLDLIESTPSIFDLLAETGPVTINLATLDGGSAIYAPTIAQGGGAFQGITLSFLQSLPVLYVPTLSEPGAEAPGRPGVSLPPLVIEFMDTDEEEILIALLTL